ncbi:MAG: hypothetical protein ACTSVV_07670, partial [Promethearchaeota archaeon]
NRVSILPLICQEINLIHNKELKINKKLKENFPKKTRRLKNFHDLHRYSRKHDCIDLKANILLISARWDNLSSRDDRSGGLIFKIGEILEVKRELIIGLANVGTFKNNFDAKSQFYKLKDSSLQKSKKKTYVDLDIGKEVLKEKNYRLIEMNLNK